MAYPRNSDDDEIDQEARDRYRVTAGELRQFIERVERLAAEIKELQGDQKEIYAEAKSRGYDTAVLRALVARRKKDREQLAEFEAIMELYREALGDV